MAKQRVNSLDYRIEEEIEENVQKQCSSERSLKDDGTTSDYSSMCEESIFGSVQERRTNQSKNRGDNRRSSLVNTAVTEEDATNICKDIGRDWRPLGRKLRFSQSQLDNIADDKNNHSYDEKAHALLTKFIHQNGSDATKTCLAEALLAIGRRDIAENLIGNEHFASKQQDEQMFFLKEEGRFNIPVDDDQNIRFFTCRNIDNGRLYLVRELVGTGYEEACKTLKQQDTIADSVLNALDVNGIVKEEKRKKENQKFKDAQEKIVELLRGLEDIALSLEKQERNEDEIQVQQQLLEDGILLGKMQRLSTALVQLTGIVSHLEDSFPLEAQMYSFTLGLSATHKDLEERIKMLKEMVPRGKTVPGEEKPQTIDQLLQRSRSLEKEIKMREKLKFMKRFQDLTLDKRPRQNENCGSSEPPPRTNRGQVHVPEIRRASTQPVSQDELKTLRQQVAPPPDPMEDVCSEGGASEL